MGSFTLGPETGQIPIDDDQYGRIGVEVVDENGNPVSWAETWPRTDLADADTTYGRILAIARVRRQRDTNGRFRVLTTPPRSAEGSSDHVFTKRPYSFEDNTLFLERERPYEEDGYGPPLTAGDVFDVRATMEPSLSDTHFAEDVAELADLAIADRAVYELLTIPRQEWTDTGVAKDFDQRYLRRLGNQKARIAQKKTKLPLRVARRPF